MSATPFITMNCGPVIVVHWTGGYHGPHYRSLNYGKRTLDAFLNRLFASFGKVQRYLNHQFESLDRKNNRNPENEKMVAKFLKAGRWAYKTASALRPFMRHYELCPTNFLHVEFVFRLEEVYNKCFAAACMFGSDEQRKAGEEGLLHDFEFTGGVGQNGEPNEGGVSASVRGYYLAFLQPTNREAYVYEEYGDIMSAIADLVKTKYPKIARNLARQMEFRLSSTDYGFGNPAISSPSKTSMLERLWNVVRELEHIATMQKEVA